MRKLSQSLGLGLLSCSLFAFISACGDDGGGNTSDGSTGHQHTTQGITTAPPLTTQGGTLTAPTTGTPTTGNPTGGGGTNSPGNTDMTGTTGGGGGTNTSDSGGTNTNDPGGPGGLPNEVKALITELCGWMDNCCMTGEFVYMLGGTSKDVNNCISLLSEEYVQNDDVDPIEQRLGEMGGSHVQQLAAKLAYAINDEVSMPVKAEVDRCTEYIKTLGCNEPIDYSERCETPDDAANAPCQLHKMFTGTLKEGQDCQEKLELVPSDIECEYGTNCEDVNKGGSSPVFKCVTKGKDGERCSPDTANTDGSCEHDQYCSLTTEKCTQRPTLGETCGYRDYEAVTMGSESIPCAEPYMCDPYTNKCVQACSAGAMCGMDSGCPSGSSCLPYFYQGQKVPGYSFCGAPRGSGGYCDTHADCSGSQHCAGGICTANLAINDDCTYDFQCGPSAYCENGAADPSPAPAPGAPPAPGVETCKSLLSSATADDGKCTGDGHRACFIGSKGCFLQGTGVTKCVAQDLPDGSFCSTSDALGLEMLEYLAPSGTPGVATLWDPVNPGGKAWHTLCASGVCSENSGGNFTCSVGLTRGKTSCDYNLSTVDKDSCKPGLHCVLGTCEEFLAPGDPCDHNYNPDQSGDVIERGFTKRICDPESECRLEKGAYYCSLIKPSIRRNNCSGNDSSPGY